MEELVVLRQAYREWRRDWPLFQLVIRTRPKLTIYIRRAPITRLNPTKGQVDVWLRLSKAVRSAKDSKGLDERYGWPKTATYALQLRGYRSPYARRRPRLWEVELQRLLAQRPRLLEVEGLLPVI